MSTRLSSRFWSGFWQSFQSEIQELERRGWLSNDIPKEEQIRSSLYAYLCKSKRGQCVEIEASIPGSEKRGEIDLRVFGKPPVLIELKRTWALSHWQNKYSESLRGWKSDVQKLNLPSASKNEGYRRCFLLVVFYGSDEFFNKIKLGDISAYMHSKWRASPLSLKEFGFGSVRCRGYVWSNP